MINWIKRILNREETEMTEENKLPTKKFWESKLNWTGLASFLIGVLAFYDIIPAGSEQKFLETVMMVGGALVPVLRTYFTNTEIEK